MPRLQYQYSFDIRFHIGSKDPAHPIAPGAMGWAGWAKDHVSLALETQCSQHCEVVEHDLVETRCYHGSNVMGTVFVTVDSTCSKEATQIIASCIQHPKVILDSDDPNAILSAPFLSNFRIVSAHKLE